MLCSPGPRGVQSPEGLARHSAFKPVVPRSFHSMQNLVSAPQAGEVGGHGEDLGGAPVSLEGLKQQESPGIEAGCCSRQAGLSDSGRNSLTSLSTYTGLGLISSPSHALGPLSASTSNINRLGIATQNGLSVSDSECSPFSVQRLSHHNSKPLPLKTSPPCVDITQDLEGHLWEREPEVLHKTSSLEKSEAVVEQVLEEKQRAWEREMDELRQNYAGQLQQVSHRALCLQHALQKQVAQLQQDKRRLQEDITVVLGHHKELEHKCMDYKKLQADMLPQLEENKWEVCQKTGEISLLKQQLRESQGEVIHRVGETVALRGQLDELSAQLNEQEEMAVRLKGSYSSKSLQVEHCKRELQRTQTEAIHLRDRLVVIEAEVQGLKYSLNEWSRESGKACGVLTTTQSCSEALCSPPTPGGDTLLSLQSDEAKVLRQQEEAGDLQQKQKAIGPSEEHHSWLDEEQHVLQYLEHRMGQLSMAGPSSTPPSPQSPPQASAIPLPLSDMRLPVVHQLKPTLSVTSHMERIQSTEI